MNFKILIIFTMTLFCHRGHCLDLYDELDELKDTYDIYEVKKFENLKIVARKNIDLVAGNYNSLTDYMKDIKKWNKHVSDWKKIEGKQLYVTYPYSPHTAIEWTPSLAKFTTTPKILYADEEYHNSTRIVSEYFHMFAHVSASQGSFIEQIGDSKINFEQNSPFTLGLGFAYQFRSMPSYSNSTSIYYSQLNAAGVKTSTGGASDVSSNVKIPAEIGLTSYMQKNYNSLFSNIYGGVDYERFTTFNLEEILEGKESSINTKVNQVVYLTAGFGLRFTVFSPINMKISASKGVVSKGKLNGTKFLLYFNQKLGTKYWYHLLYKQHSLSGGSSRLSVGRFGVGFGMSLF